MICPQCNKEFIRIHNSQRYCSKDCYKLFYKIKVQSLEGKINKQKADKKYQQSEKGKKKAAKYNKSIGRTKSNKKYNRSEKGAEKRKKWHTSAEGKISLKRYSQSDKGKKAIKEYPQSEKGKASSKRFKQSDKGKKAGRDLYHKQYNSDVMFKLKHIARARLSSVLKSKNIKKPTTKTQNFKSTTIELFGCTPEYLKKHLEKQFHRHPDTHQLMNWKNHTVHGWHIDHRIPLDSAKTSEDIVKLNHYTNLRPMWATENLKKGNKIN